MKTIGTVHLSHNKVPFDRISEGNEESSVLTMGSKSFDLSQMKQQLQENEMDSSDEEDDFRG